MAFPNDSFNFGATNSLEDWGIKIIAHDVFSPNKRPRNKMIPFRHGRHDGGRKYYDERIVRLDCLLTRKMSKAECREIIYWLSQRAQLRLWDEQDKYYIGELEESVDVDVFPNEVNRQFTLPMRCEPFAYSTLNRIPIINGINPIDYKGTAETPTLLIIRNPNNFLVSNITITAMSYTRA